MSVSSDREDLNDGSTGETDRGAQQPPAPQATLPIPESHTADAEAGVELRLKKIQLQVGEEGIRYYLRSSSHEPENGEGSVKDTSFSSDGEDLNNRGTGESDRGARQPHAPQAPCTSLKGSSNDGGARRGQLVQAASAKADSPDQKGLVVDKGQVRSSPGG